MQPPNLRDAHGEMKRCGNCTFFDGVARCKRYSARVRSSQVCDGYRRKSTTRPRMAA